MVQPGMINLDFSDIKTVMSEMGKAMMGTGEASGEGRAIAAAEAAIANPLIDDVSLKGAKGLIINITGGKDITLYEVDEAANRVKQEIDEEANIIYGTTCDDRLEGLVRVSIVATGIDANVNKLLNSNENFAPIQINNEIYKKDNVEENIKFDIDRQQSEISDSKDINQNLINTEDTDTNIQNENSFLDKTNILKDEDLITKTESDFTDQIIPSISEDKSLHEVDPQIIKNISENDNDFPPNDEDNQETSVRRLSLFDTFSADDSKLDPKENEPYVDKSEPVLSSEEEEVTEVLEKGCKSSITRL